MRHFIRTRIFSRHARDRHGNESSSCENEPAVILQTSLPPSRQIGDDDRSEVREFPRNSHESHDHDHEEFPQSLSRQRTIPDSASHHHCPLSTFEGLPPEIRLTIVESGLCVEDLRAAVRASPALHRQYRLADRRLMLRSALDTSLGPALVDMWAVHYTGKIDFGPPKETEKDRIVAFMTKYLELRDTRTHGKPFKEQLRTGDLIEMSNYYLSVVKRILCYFSDLFLGNLRGQLAELLTPTPESDVVSSPGSASSSEYAHSLPTGSWHEPYEDGEQVDGLAPQDGAIIDAGCEVYLQKCPSRSEAVRLTRAIYRVQLWCNIFGFGMGPYKVPASVSRWEMACMFHETFEPWEVEEMLCIFQSMRKMVESLFKDAREDLLNYNEQHKEEISFFTYGNDIRDYDFHIDCFIQSAVSRGLPYFLHLLSIPDDDTDARLRLVIDNVGEWLHQDLSSSASDGVIRRDLDPSRNDLREYEHEPLFFLGDSFATTPGPPFCWCLMWKGTYSNRYGDDVPEELRNWGYIFWDRERVVGSKARELLLHIWKSYHWVDPRTFHV